LATFYETANCSSQLVRWRRSHLMPLPKANDVEYARQ
jgi:hypothetical protein